MSEVDRFVYSWRKRQVKRALLTSSYISFANVAKKAETKKGFFCFLSFSLHFAYTNSKKNSHFAAIPQPMAKAMTCAPRPEPKPLMLSWSYRLK